jgi:hypothetical protein
MSVTAWVVWFGAQTLVLLLVLGIAMFGVTGRLTREQRTTSPARTQRRHHRHHLSFRHHAAH